MATATETEISTLLSRREGVVGGSLCITGTRMPVLRIGALSRAGMSAEEIVENYELEPAGVHAALAHYFANRRAFDQQLDEEAAEFDRCVEEQEREWDRRRAATAEGAQ